MGWLIQGEKAKVKQEKWIRNTQCNWLDQIFPNSELWITIGNQEEKIQWNVDEWILGWENSVKPLTWG